jgi:hypothetical protein
MPPELPENGVLKLFDVHVDDVVRGFKLLKSSKEHKISIVYNFIGAFDFFTASESAEAVQMQKRTA